MRVATAIVFAASLAAPVLGAATKWYSDTECKDFIDKKVYNGASEGDAVIPMEGVGSIMVDSIMDPWFAYNGAGGDGCAGEQLGRLPNKKCVKIFRKEGDEGYGIMCTRLCSGGGIFGTGECAPKVIS
ncbi:hypothetical protein VTJ49DRAFT_7032 [Mycothermus thermophilus]|uniref:Uncharacterized protein n=1 Tax=Humicola insolens TaxID=85995 RepID=A0ABR3VIC5_HUMIN